jgi:hypothetical protein
VLSGTPAQDSTHQHVEVLVNESVVASFGVEQPNVGASVAAQDRTDIAYSVDITGYETLAAAPNRYLAGSGCCVNGVVARACESGYVGRLLRGSGRLRYLRRLGAEARARVGPVLSAGGGARYELIDETTFVDAFFAFVPEPLESLCTALRPEQELAAFKVVAADNCRVRAYTSKRGGSKLIQSAYFPSAESCFRAAARACADEPEVHSCPASYHTSDGSVSTRDLVTGETWETAPPLPALPDPNAGVIHGAGVGRDAGADTGVSTDAGTDAGPPGGSN